MKKPYSERQRKLLLISKLKIEKLLSDREIVENKINKLSQSLQLIDNKLQKNYKREMLRNVRDPYRFEKLELLETEQITND